MGNLLSFLLDDGLFTLLDLLSFTLESLELAFDVELLAGLVWPLVLLDGDVGSLEKNGEENREGADLTEEGRDEPLGLGELDFMCLPVMNIQNAT